MRFFLIQMIFCILCLQPVCAEHEFSAHCDDSANSVASLYFMDNVGRQLSVESNANQMEKQNAKIRNLCFGAVHRCIYLTQLASCSGYKDTESVMYDIPLYEFNECSKVDCFDGDIGVAKNTAKKFNQNLYDMFLPNMDKIVSQTISGNGQELIENGIIDASPVVCWDADSNGDNIWHGLVRSDSDIASIANLCISDAQSENTQEAFYTAILYSKNNSGETPVQEAIRTNHTRLINWLNLLLHNDKATCNKLAEEIIKQTNMDMQSVKNILRC